MPINAEMDNSEWEGPDRRRESSPWMEGIPAWARIVAVIGLPGALALILIWVLVEKLPVSREEHAVILAEQKFLRERSDARDVKQDQVYRLLQRICTNTAKSDVERQRCFDN